MKALKVILLILSITLVSTISAQEVFTTKTGEKYHKSSCRYLKNSKYIIELKKAIELGYDPCSVCKPTTKVKKSTSNTSSLTASKSNTPAPKSTKKVTATQCAGKTKAGARCKRKTKNGNGRCYQH